MIMLTGVFYTHLWINGSNTFVKICEYRAPKSASYTYYLTPRKIWVYPDRVCPQSVKIKNK
jgi:hypothetical protein